MKLAIVIVSWNTKKLTLNCLKSIFKYLNGKIDFDIFLVDNASTDCTINEVEKLKRENNLNNLYIFANKENMGFAKANNLALRFILEKFSETDYVLLLNPDTELMDESLLEMINFAEENKIEIVGPKLLNSDGSLQRSCRRFPKLLDQVLIQLKFYNLWPEKFESIKNYFMLDFKHDEICEVDQVMGAGMLIKKSVFEKIGLLDEKFWAIFEEVDFCKRAKEAMYKIYFYPNTKIVHHKEQSFKQMMSMRKQINFNRSLYYYFQKHKSWWQFFILWFLQPINLFLTLVDSLVGVRKFLGKKKDF